MKKPKRLLAALLCGALLFSATACNTVGGSSSNPGGSGGTPTATGTGRYVETDVTPPDADDALDLYQTAEGNLRVYNSNYTLRWDSADNGDTWTQSPGPLAGIEDLAYVSTGTATEEGGFIGEIARMDLATTAFTSEYVNVSPSGTVEPFSLPELDALLAEGKSPYISTLKALPGGRLLLGASWGGYYTAPMNDESDGLDDPDGLTGAGGEDEDEEPAGSADLFNFDESDFGTLLAIFDLATGEKIADLEETYPSGVTWDEENLYVLEDNLIYTYSLATGEKQEGTLAVGETGEINWFGIGFATKDGSLYYANTKALTAYSPSGTAETLLNGTAHSFGDPSGSITGLLVLPEESFLLNQYTGEGTSALLRYDWDETASYNPDKTLKIWSLEDSANIRAAIAALRREHPDALVEYEAVLAGDAALTANDAIKNLNMEILAGTGPDIIVLDGVPMDSYVSQGMLADLTGLVDTGSFYSALLNSLGENAAYYLPARFNLPALLGDEDALEAATTLVAFVEYILGRPARDAANPDYTSMFNAVAEAEKSAFEFENFDELFDVLWGASGSEILKGDAIDAEALTRFLTALQSISQHYNLGAVDPDMEGGAMMTVSTGGSGATLTGSTLNYLFGRTKLGSLTLSDLMLMASVVNSGGENLSLLPGLAEGAWVPVDMVGINAKSTRQEFAAAFLNTLFSDAVQGTRADGLPVTKAGMQQQVAEVNDILKSWATMETEQTGEPLEEGLDPDNLFPYDMDALVASLKTPTLADAEITSKVYSNALALCRGETDLEGCVNTIEQETKSYLAERRQ